MNHQKNYPMDERKAIIESASDGMLPSTDVREPIPEFEESVDIRDYIDVVLRRKWIVLTFLVVVFVTTLVMSLTATPLFKARGRLELSLRAPRVTKFEDIEGARSYVPTQEFMQTHVELLQSDSLAERVVKKLRLEEHPLYAPPPLSEKPDTSLTQKLKGFIGGFFKASDGSELQGGASVDTPAEETRKEVRFEKIFLGGLEVIPERETTLISLAYSSPDPVLARDAVNTLIDEFIEWQMDKKIMAAANAKKQLDKQIEIARIQVEKSEAELNKFAQKAGIVSLDSKLNLIYTQLEEINSALSKTEAQRMEREALYNTAKEGNIKSLPAVLENPLIQQLRAEHIDLMSQYEELKATFKEAYPSVRRIRARMQDIEEKVDREEHLILEALEQDYLTALEREKNFRKKAEEYKGLALALNEKATQYKILEREVETSKQIHQSLLERAKEIDANVGADIGNIQVVDYAKTPLWPYKPNVRRNLLLAILVGVMGGVGIAFFLEYLDNTIKGVNEVSDRFGIPVLGIIPLVDKKTQKNLGHLVRLEPTSSFSEAIRTTRFSIQLSSSMDYPPKLLLITSVLEDEGKTTIASNLAQAFAASEEKVLIVDCDMRKPRLHKVFSNSSKDIPKGLSHFLSGLCNLEDIIHKPDIHGLYFVPAGPRPPNPAELLASRRMKRAIEELSKRFDRIIIDSPPCGGFADVLVLANQTNGVILVSTLGNTPRDTLRMCRKNLYNVNGYLLGCIINKLDQSYRYGDYYYRYHRYYKNYYTPYQPLDDDDDDAYLLSDAIDED